MLKRDILQALFLATLVGLCMWLILGRIGVQDSDAYSYVVGAYSIQEGSGYKDLTGGNLNHWPPGYSFMLSFFLNPLQGALVINSVFLGLCVGLVYLLAIKNEWNRQIALSFSLAIGFGFLRVLASNAKPDILTYALFLLGVLFYGMTDSRLNIMSYLIWSALIPLKLIAIVFVPAGIIAGWTGKGPLKLKKDYAKTAAIILVWILSLSSIAAFNYLTTKEIITGSHSRVALSEIPQLLSAFVISLPRLFICNWYGSIRDIKILVPFFICVALGIACFISLRPSLAKNAGYIKLGISILVLILLLNAVRRVSLAARLTGYGLLVLFFAFRPLDITKKRWILYAIISIGIASFNMFSVNSLGANDPRYESMVHELAACDIPREPIYTNSFHILDIHARIPSIPVSETDSIEKGAYFLWVDMPSYDGITTTVWPVEKPGRGWRKIVSVENAILFKKE